MASEINAEHAESAEAGKLFPVITDRHWARALRRERGGVRNEVREQIAQKILPVGLIDFPKGVLRNSTKERL